MTDTLSKEVREVLENELAELSFDVQVGRLMPSGKTIPEIADELSQKLNRQVSRFQVKASMIRVREHWSEAASQTIEEYRLEELTYARQRRQEALDGFSTAPIRGIAFANAILAWSHYIAKLLGLYAPIKIDDSSKDWKKLAAEKNISEEEIALAALKHIAGDRLPKDMIDQIEKILIEGKVITIDGERGSSATGESLLTAGSGFGEADKLETDTR